MARTMDWLSQKHRKYNIGDIMGMNNSEKNRGICQSGGKKLKERYVNEDFIKIGQGYSFLMDGATGLGGPEAINM